MNLPELVIFDMDGLIFNTERLFMNRKADVLREYGYEARDEDYIRTLGTAGQQLTDILHEIYGPDYPAAEISQKTRQIVNAEIAKNGPEVKAGIRELLQWIHAKNIPCCVASSTPHIYVEKYLRQAGLLEYFSHIIGGDEIRRSKPEPDIFLAACGYFHTTPSRALVLEDSENGILAAWNAGIPVVCIPDLKMPSVNIAQKTAAIVNTADKVAGLFEDI